MAAAVLVCVVGLAVDSELLAWGGLAAAIASAGALGVYFVLTERRRGEEALGRSMRARGRARALTDLVVTAEQEERRRLALFLHDGPVQSMSGSR